MKVGHCKKKKDFPKDIIKNIITYKVEYVTSKVDIFKSILLIKSQKQLGL